MLMLKVSLLDKFFNDIFNLIKIIIKIIKSFFLNLSKCPYMYKIVQNVKLS